MVQSSNPEIYYPANNSFSMNKNISSGIIRSKYSKCFESQFLKFYESKLATIKVGDNCSPFQLRFCPAIVAKKNEVSVTHPNPKSPSKPINPFLPFDRNLLVSDLNSEYALIFNKFCVVPEHLLIITKEFVHQAAPYSPRDFEVVDEILIALKDKKPLAFYNSGPEAGASQEHRHFQVIPTEVSPIEDHIVAVDQFDEPFSIPLYSSFKHGCIRKNSSSYSSVKNWYFDAYEKLMAYCKMQSTPYNLLWTEDWMLMVPRRKEFSDDGANSLNAMAFAGYFLIMNEEHLSGGFDVIKTLEQVTFPTSHASLK